MTRKYFMKDFFVTFIKKFLKMLIIKFLLSTFFYKQPSYNQDHMHHSLVISLTHLTRSLQRMQFCCLHAIPLCTHIQLSSIIISQFLRYFYCCEDHSEEFYELRQLFQHKKTLKSEKNFICKLQLHNLRIKRM